MHYGSYFNSIVQWITKFVDTSTYGKSKFSNLRYEQRYSLLLVTLKLNEKVGEFNTRS